MSWCPDGRYNGDSTSQNMPIQTAADVPDLAKKLAQLKNGT